MEFHAKKKPFEKRLEEAQKIAKEYPDKIPIICEKYYKDSKVASLEKTKYLVPSDISAVQFGYIIRKRIKMSKEQALFLFVNGKEALKGDTMLISIYEKKKDKDGFLYIAYACENVLGKFI